MKSRYNLRGNSFVLKALENASDAPICGVKTEVTYRLTWLGIGLHWR